MEAFVSPAIAGLTGQLLRGPKRLRLKQLLGIEFLLSLVEGDKSYPFDFVCHALTGFRPAVHGMVEDKLLQGEDLINDLVVLAEILSQDGDLSLEATSEPVFSAQDLADRLGVSTKTIFRWRRRGLVSWKFRCTDRRIRVYFPDRAVRRFVAQNGELVQRGSSFSQLSGVERAGIVSRAEELVGAGHRTVNSVAKVISVESGRAVETIRLILKAHDEAHPEKGVFNKPRLRVAPDDQRLTIWEAYVDGATVESLAARYSRSVQTIYRIVTQMRARDIKARRIEFVPSADFEAPDAGAMILKAPALVTAGEKMPERRVPAGLPPYLQQLFRQPLLSAESEVALFRKMNYLKYEAARLRDAIDPDHVTASELDRIDDLLAQANVVKNVITQANLRLVVSIAKKHTAFGQDFFEVVSDGNLSLMRAIEKFDYTRGFKFSTYGSWAIMKNYARSVPEQRTLRDRYQTGREEFLDTIPGIEFDEAEDDSLRVVRGALDRMLETLEPRERNILRQRFGLDGPGEPQTLEQIGREFGVSKERIRQLESRAMARLRTDFGTEIEQLLGA